MSPDGKPIQVNASTLQAAAAQNAVGMLYISKSDNSIITRIVNNVKSHCKTIESWNCDKYYNELKKIALGKLYDS